MDWVKLYRKSVDSRVFSDDWLWRLWCWCLLKAEWRERWVGGRNIKPGQFLTGRDQAAGELCVSVAKWRRGIETLREWGSITVETANKFTLITICNWRTYQKPEDEKDDFWPTNGQQTANKRPTNGQQTANVPIGEETKEIKEGEERAPAIQPSPNAAALATKWIFYRRGHHTRGELEAASSTFDELLRVGVPYVDIDAEISRPDRVKSEPIWVVEKRLLIPVEAKKVNGNGRYDGLKAFVQRGQDDAT